MTKISINKRNKIRELRAHGFSLNEIAKETGVSKGSVFNITHEKTENIPLNKSFKPISKQQLSNNISTAKNMQVHYAHFGNNSVNINQSPYYFRDYYSPGSNKIYNNPINEQIDLNHRLSNLEREIIFPKKERKRGLPEIKSRKIFTTSERKTGGAEKGRA